MLRIIDRYLLRELVFGVGASAVVLLVITLGGTIADILSKVARGRVPANLMFELLGLRTVDAMTVLLPLAVFLGVLLAYGRLWRDSEMAIFQASGLSIAGLVRPLLLLTVPAIFLLVLISFWLAPSAVRLSQRLLEEASRSMVVVGMEPGRFIELPGRSGVIFVGGMSADGTRFERMFVESERADGEDQRIDVITAERGELYRDTDGEGRFLSLRDGFRIEGRLGRDDFRLLRFRRNDIALPDSEVDASADSVKRAVPTLMLLASEDPIQKAEVHWRLAAPLSTLVLTLLALPLSRVMPREARYGKLLIAVLCYLIYVNCLGLGRAWISQEKLPTAAGFWWVHIPAALIGLYLLWRSLQMPRSKTRVRSGA